MLGDGATRLVYFNGIYALCMWSNNLREVVAIPPRYHDKHYDSTDEEQDTRLRVDTEEHQDKERHYRCSQCGAPDQHNGAANSHSNGKQRLVALCHSLNGKKPQAI